MSVCVCPVYMSCLFLKDNSYKQFLLVVAVHEGYIAWLSLVRICLLCKPLMKPDWHQVLNQYNWAKHSACTTSFFKTAVAYSILPGYGGAHIFSIIRGP